MLILFLFPPQVSIRILGSLYQLLFELFNKNLFFSSLDYSEKLKYPYIFLNVLKRKTELLPR